VIAHDAQHRQDRIEDAERANRGDGAHGRARGEQQIQDRGAPHDVECVVANVAGRKRQVDARGVQQQQRSTFHQQRGTHRQAKQVEYAHPRHAAGPS